MTSQNRTFFESALLHELKKIEGAERVSIAASKNKLKFKWEKKVVADIFFQHLARADAYVLGGLVYGGPIFDHSSQFTPPYKSNLPNDSCYSFTSSGEKDNRFCRAFGGSTNTPNVSSAENVCINIRKVLEEFYVPSFINRIVPGKRTMEDVLTFPEDYAYPAVFVFASAALKPEIFNEEVFKAAVSNKKVIKNERFDIALLSRLMSSQ
ncbi:MULTISPECIES: hypothetical protein [Pseudomonas]|uniref:Uncharacterized protein n=1 Tax=Pseudomonas quercus TaxID=2722792 RepID=A0ABX0YK40_9PSED|nr:MULTISPECIES: hypothetical protein [Pseudomonas]MBF7143651.1 hypothetical protein [Pseudomonas sp. LY10J]NJP02318.1 hypothetical protein [Pseudomonas quercus]